ncbi:hypothetical protein [Streptomyces nitrosporeus]|uniref:hypothetical protein n=1 Tax=Streptomyces nitrosporeus TaxID=28894 RepID=UPI0039A13F5D
MANSAESRARRSGSSGRASGRRRPSLSRRQGDIAYSYATARTHPAGSRSLATSGQRAHATWKARSTDCLASFL